MATESAHKDFVLAPRASGQVSWIETILLSVVVIALGYWLSPADPLLVYGTFPWLILAPLLLAVRYGFMRGLISALILVAALFAYRASGLGLYAELPASFVVGVMISTMLIGEFRDIWERRVERLDLANEYRQLRLDEFTRAHYILRISHDRLEKRVAGNDQSLRSSLLGLRAKMRDLPRGEAAISVLSESILTLLAQYGSFRVASLHKVNADHSVVLEPLSSMGEVRPMPADDLLVRQCLKQGQLVSVREELMERGENRKFSQYQVCVPLKDTEDRIVALLAVEQMPFFAFTQRVLSLLMILCGHIADLLQTDQQTLQLADMDAQDFSKQLKRSLNDAVEHDLEAHMFAIEASPGEHRDALLRLVEDSRRGLDVQLRVDNERGNPCVLVLLPLTSADGGQGYLTRLNGIIHERFGLDQSFESLGINIREFDISGQGGRESLRRFLFNECAINDQQVAI
ncbi:Sugar transporter [Pseudomonas marincola]|uniref:Sugar transporter n=1 Tax=Pseudomonas marincola TaxID=437900 RepID=A0A653E3Y7_9PSED|nr:PelD GGDEF domain-containing protein [Pseudomonas marincola]CAE6881695.1 Sugar transporter [Pseudomonas marincola]